MIQKVKHYFNTTATPFDYLRRNRKKKGVLNIGWCSVFPPSHNGAAMVTYTVLRKFRQETGVRLNAIPFGGRIEKKLFPGMGITTVDDPALDAVVFFCLGPHLERFFHRVRTKTIVWQTAHESILADTREADLFTIMKKADLILAMTQKACREYRANGARNVDYLPAGVDTDVFFPRQRQEGPLRVLCATRVHYYKGVSAYLESIPLVVRQKPDIIFTLHGPIDYNTNYYDEIMSLIAKIKKDFPGNFIYQGEWLPPEDVPAVFRGADVFVFPSDNEGFGVPLIEAMSCGMPCIVLDKFPMNEVVQDGTTGFCLPLKKESMSRYHGYRFPHPEDIAGAILRLAGNADERRRMEEEARRRVQQQYSLDACVRKLISSIEAVTKVEV